MGLYSVNVCFVPGCCLFPSIIKKLPIGKTGYGFELSPQTDVITIGARLDYGINNDSKISFGGAIGFTDDDFGTFVTYGGDVPPFPLVGMSILHIETFKQYELEFFFLQGGFAGAFRRVITSYDLLSGESTDGHSLWSYTLSGGGGILKRLKTQSEWVISPFFALSYTNVWVIEESRLHDFEETGSDGSFGGTVGLEIEMSPKMSIISSFAFSFQSSDTVFSIGLNFH